MAPDSLDTQPLTGGLLNSAVSKAVVRVHRDYLGRGPTRARTSLRDNVLVVIMEDTLTKAERSLVGDGKADDVLQMRHSFQRTMEADMVAAVERLSGRRVIAFGTSSNHIDPDLASETFVLEPDTSESGDGVVTELALEGDGSEPSNEETPANGTDDRGRTRTALWYRGASVIPALRPDSASNSVKRDDEARTRDPQLGKLVPQDAAGESRTMRTRSAMRFVTGLCCTHFHCRCDSRSQSRVWA